MAEYVLNHAADGSTIKLRVDRDPEAPGTITVDCGNKAHRVEVVQGQDGDGWLVLDGQIVPFCVLRDKKTLHVWVRGRTHSFALSERTAQRAGAAAHAGPIQEQLTAPMPGTILKINVRTGDSFAAHAPLIVMESMKMEMTLSASHPGRIADVLCRAGQLVEMGAVLARFEGVAK